MYSPLVNIDYIVSITEDYSANNRQLSSAIDQKKGSLLICVTPGVVISHRIYGTVTVYRFWAVK